MKTKNSIILFSWMFFGALLSIAGGLFLGPVLMASYHPNNPKSPYVIALGNIWLVSMAVAFLTSLLLSIFKRIIPVDDMAKVVATIYGGLAVGGMVTLLSTAPVPKDFAYYIGQSEYRIPSVFTRSRGGRGLVTASMCLENLKGVYSAQAKNCKTTDITLSEYPLNLRKNHSLSSFFREADSSGIDGNSLALNQNVKKYRIPSEELPDSHETDTYWFKYELDRVDGEPDAKKTAYFQVDAQDKALRFVTCHQFDNCNDFCQYQVSTSEITVSYKLQGSAKFELDRWVQTEVGILDLISEWKVD